MLSFLLYRFILFKCVVHWLVKSTQVSAVSGIFFLVWICCFKTWILLFLRPTPPVSRRSMQADILSHSSPQLMSLTWFIAVPLTSLSPSSFLSAPHPLSLHSSLLPPRFSSTSLCPLCSLPHSPAHSFLNSIHPLLSPLHSAAFLQSSLSNGDKGRQADYLSNGKKRKADEKEFMTDYVRMLSWPCETF